MKISRYFRLVISIFSIFTIFFAIPQQTLATNVSNNSAIDKSLLIAAKKALASKNYKAALVLFKKAAPSDATGLVDFQIGIMYWYGQGAPKSLDASLFWESEALKKVTNKHVRANIMTCMGTNYARLNNYVMSFRLYRQAAMMGNPDAQYFLAAYYDEGKGTIQDHIKSYAWLSVALAQGLDIDTQNSARKAQDALASKLGWEPGQLERAQSLAKKYFKLYVPHEIVPTK